MRTKMLLDKHQTGSVVVLTSPPWGVIAGADHDEQMDVDGIMV